MECDVAIVGCGPAGLTAAIYAGRYGMKTLIFESTPSQLVTVHNIENYPGFKGSGYELLEKMKEQATRFAEHVFESVIDVRSDGKYFTLKTDYSEYKAKAVIFATGGRHKELNVPGESEFLGRGVSYCATCDGHFFRGKKVLVIGGGNTAVTDAVYLKEIGCNVTLVHRRDELRADKALQEELFRREIPVIWNSVVVRIEGSDKVERVVLHDRNKNEDFTVETDGVFIAIGMKPQTELAAKLGVERDHRGYIKVDKKQRTNVPGVFAAGDCCDNPLKQVVTACGDGAVAANSAFEYLKNL
jgi:thioredoxin reductase (NADPH)